MRWYLCMQGDRGRKGKAPKGTEGATAELEAGSSGRPDPSGEQTDGSVPEEAAALPTIVSFVAHLQKTQVVPAAP